MENHETCYYFECDNLNICNYKENECEKIIRKDINGIKFVFYIICDIYGGRLIRADEPNEIYPVKDTFDGWVEIYNSYYIKGLSINKEFKLFKHAGFFSLEECERYINEDFVSIYKDFLFKF